MIVYRLECRGANHQDNVGKGVYMGNLAHLATDTSEDYEHPAPFEEPRLMGFFNSSYVCCFTSLRDLRQWFELLDEVELNKRSLLQIATYTVPNEYFHQGRVQGICMSDEMVCVEKHDIDYEEKLL